MKKRVIAFLAVLAMIMSMTVTAFANADYYENVFDTAGILTDEEAARFEARAAEITNKYGMGVYIVTIPNLSDYGFTEDQAYDCAKYFYTESGYGVGDDGSGIMLLLSMSERKYALIAHGAGNQALTDYGNEKMREAFLDDFGDDEWAVGFDHYLEKADRYISLWAEGKPVDSGSDPDDHSWILCLAVAIFVGALGAFIYCCYLESEMKTAVIATNAEGYETENGVEITVSEDTYLHSTTEVRTIEHDSDSGGTSVDSDGFSGSSGDF
ncbi:MAG: hypothetical protein E7300_01430 [Lachnospiraceae bacterium]|nr:hypothetical protein [Lachnospiraceae bacterium]